VTKRVAALYDIHANLPALEAVLRDVREEDVDEIVIGGDIVPGPMPKESLECLLDLNMKVQFIQGNGDRVVLDQMRSTQSDEVPEAFREVIRWVAAHLTPGDKHLLAGWPKTLRMEIPTLGKVLFCHATPRSDVELFTKLTPEEPLIRVFDNQDAAVVVCGHTHMQFDRTIGRIRVVNAGSVGTPFGEPGAYWLLLGPGIELRRTQYDLDAAAARIRRTSYPRAEEFAARSILEPPSEAQMLAAFGAATAAEGR
jgi:predicted phosphodiesterase